MPRTFVATLEFDGTQYAGWQRQRVGRTVQQELETVLSRLAGHPVRAHAAGRTDAGVHALGLGVSFALPDRWTPDALLGPMNALLPSDAAVTAIREARPGFHARKCAEGRRYEYRIGTDESARSPFRSRYEWALGQPLDAERLAAATATLLGVHDFGGFAVKSASRRHDRCDIRVARWAPRPDVPGVRLDIAADRFLHHMVRVIVATVVDVALGRRSVADVVAVLERQSGARASALAPAEGLYFLSADYPESWFDLSEAA
jgi:tRNA pseudouridine38-40 synthase